MTQRAGGFEVLDVHHHVGNAFRALGGLLFAGIALLFLVKAAALLAPLEALLQTPALAPYRAYLLLGFKAFLVLAVAVILLGQIPRLYRAFTGMGAGAQLLEAIENGDAPAVERYLAEGVSVTYVNEHDQNALLIALEKNQFAVAHELIRRGADVNLRSKMNHTPLSLAARRNDTESVRLIMQHVGRIDEAEKQTLMWPIAHRNIEMLRVMLDSGPDLAALFRFGPTLGDAARQAGFGEAVELIRAAGGTFTTE